MSGAWPICCSASDTPPVAPPGLPVRDSDYLGVSTKTGSQGKAESAFLYRQSDGATLALALAPQRLVLNGRIVTLDLSDKQQGWDWLAQASAKELAALRHVRLPEELSTNTAMVSVKTLLLRKLAAANPGVGLICEGGTDTAAALRAIEIEAQVLLMAKNHVDGIYSADPKKDHNAIKFDKLTHLEALNLRLRVMDSTAFSLCLENKLPIIVFDVEAPGGIEHAAEGESIGTIVTSEV